MKTAEQIIDEGWQTMFDEINTINDDLFELKVEYQEATTGKTIIRSWQDRDKRLRGDTQQ